jgi:hypothetical protein
MFVKAAIFFMTGRDTKQDIRVYSDLTVTQLTFADLGVLFEREMNSVSKVVHDIPASRDANVQQGRRQSCSGSFRWW